MIKSIFVQNKKWLLTITFLFCLILAASLTMFMAQPSADASNEIGDYSFLRISQAAAQFLGHSQDIMYGGQMPDVGLVSSNALATNNAYGNAGGLLGYQDVFDEDNSVGAICSAKTRNTVEYYYHTLANIKVKGADEDASKLLFAGYGYYGYALSSLGMDKTTVGGGNGLRPLVGGIILALYVLSSLVNTVFLFVVTALKWLNPFRLFLFAGHGADGASEAYTTGNKLFVGPGGSSGSLLTGWIDESEVTDWSSALQYGTQRLQIFLADIYNFMQEHALIIIIVLTVCSIAGWLLFSAGKSGGKKFGPTLKTLLIRIVFLVIGVPLMFTAYTAALSTMSGFIATEGNVSANIVFSTFFDFEKWVYTNRLNPGKTNTDEYNIAVVFDGDDYTASVDGVTIARVRQIAQNYNRRNYGDSVVPRLSLTGSGSTTPTQLQSADGENMISEQLEEMYQFNYVMSHGVADVADPSLDTKETYQVVLSMLTRYMQGSVVTGASYESYVINRMLDAAIGNDPITPQSLNNNVNAKNAVWEFAITHNWRNFDPNQASERSKISGQGGGNGIVLDALTDTDIKNAAETRFSGDAKLAGNDNITTDDLWGSGTLIYRSPTSFGSILGKIWNTLSGGSATSVSSGMNHLVFESSSSQHTAYGLSAIAMYNYLNTSFDDSKMSVYSSGMTATDQVQVGHYAVNSVGSTGLTRVVYIIDAIALMSCIVVLGFGYAFGILFSNFKAIFKAVPAIMSGMIGSLRGIATSLALVVAMIIEVLCTVILYQLSTRLIYAMSDIIERPLSLLLKNSTSTALYQFAPFVFGLISAVCIVWLTFQLLHWRVTICRAATEACSSLIAKFVGVSGMSSVDLHGRMSAGQVLAGAATAVVGAKALGVDVDGMKEAAGERISDFRDAVSGKGSYGVTDADGNVVGGSTTQADTYNRFGVRGSGGATSTGLLAASVVAGAEAVGDKMYGGSSSNRGDRVGPSTSNTRKIDGLHNMSITDNPNSVQGVTGDLQNIQANVATDAQSSMSADMHSSADVSGQEYVSGEVKETISDGVNGDSGSPLMESQSSDAIAERFVEERKASFLSLVNGAVAAQEPNVQKAKAADVATLRENYRANGNPHDSGTFVVTDSNGVQTQGLSIVRSDTGETYTLADKLEGADFTVQDSDGNVYVDSDGVEYSNMSSENIAVSSTRDGEKISTIRDQNGTRSAVMSQVDVGRVEVTDSMGVKTQNLRVVNAETGNVYSMADKTNGANFSVVNQDGSVYVDSAGNNYQNVSSNMIEMDKTSGMVTRFGASDENGQVHVNQVYDANETVYGYNSVITSQAANNIGVAKNQSNTPLVVPGQSVGGPLYQTYNENMSQNMYQDIEGNPVNVQGAMAAVPVSTPHGGGGVNVYEQAGDIHVQNENGVVAAPGGTPHVAVPVAGGEAGSSMNVYQRSGDIYAQGGDTQEFVSAPGGGQPGVVQVRDGVVQQGGTVIMNGGDTQQFVSQQGGAIAMNQRMDQRVDQNAVYGGQQVRMGDQYASSVNAMSSQRFEQVSVDGGRAPAAQGGTRVVNVPGGTQVVGAGGDRGSTVVIPVVAGMNARPGAAPAAQAPAAPAAASQVVNNSYFTQGGSRVERHTHVDARGGNQQTTVVNEQRGFASPMDRGSGGVQRMPVAPAAPRVPDMPSAPRAATPAAAMPAAPAAPATPSSPSYHYVNNNYAPAPQNVSGGRDTFTREVYNDHSEVRRDVPGAPASGGGPVGRDTVIREAGRPGAPGQVRTEYRENNSSRVVETHDRSATYDRSDSFSQTTRESRSQTTRENRQHTVDRRDTRSVERTIEHDSHDSGNLFGDAATPGRRAPSDNGRDYGDNPFDRRS